MKNNQYSYISIGIFLSFYMMFCMISFDIQASVQDSKDKHSSISKEETNSSNQASSIYKEILILKKAIYNKKTSPEIAVPSIIRLMNIYLNNSMGKEAINLANYAKKYIQSGQIDQSYIQNALALGNIEMHNYEEGYSILLKMKQSDLSKKSQIWLYVLKAYMKNSYDISSEIYNIKLHHKNLNAFKDGSLAHILLKIAEAHMINNDYLSMYKILEPSDNAKSINLLGYDKSVFYDNRYLYEYIYLKLIANFNINNYKYILFDKDDKKYFTHSSIIDTYKVLSLASLYKYGKYKDNLNEFIELFNLNIKGASKEYTLRYGYHFLMEYCNKNFYETPLGCIKGFMIFLETYKNSDNSLNMHYDLKTYESIYKTFYLYLNLYIDNNYVYKYDNIYNAVGVLSDAYYNFKGGFFLYDYSIKYKLGRAIIKRLHDIWAYKEIIKFGNNYITDNIYSKDDKIVNLIDLIRLSIVNAYVADLDISNAQIQLDKFKNHTSNYYKIGKYIIDVQFNNSLDIDFYINKEIAFKNEEIKAILLRIFFNSKSYKYIYDNYKALLPFIDNTYLVTSMESLSIIIASIAEHISSLDTDDIKQDKSIIQPLEYILKHYNNDLTSDIKKVAIKIINIVQEL